MTSKQFTIRVKDVGTSDDTAWDEQYNKIVDDPQMWAVDTIAKFNASLRPAEKARVLVSVTIESNGQPLQHSWSKTNAVTIIKGGRIYDTYVCTHCGATGKRLGVEEGVRVDAKMPKLCKQDVG